MNFISIVPQYIAWHYTKSIEGFVRIWMRFFWFLGFFFSFKELLRTLFSPFARLNEKYKKGFKPSDFFSTLIVNTLMRIVGAIIRLFIIILGIISIILLAVLGVAFFIIWIILPLFMAFLVLISVDLLFPSVSIF